MKRRIDLIYRNKLRPEVIYCMLLGAVMLVCIGLAHVWVGLRQDDRTKELKKARQHITQLENEIRLMETELEKAQEQGRLAIQMRKFALPLEKFPGDEPIELPEPEISALQLP
jgi:hypothetical protein